MGIKMNNKGLITCGKVVMRFISDGFKWNEYENSFKYRNKDTETIKKHGKYYRFKSRLRRKIQKCKNVINTGLSLAWWSCTYHFLSLCMSIYFFLTQSVDINFKCFCVFDQIVLGVQNNFRSFSSGGQVCRAIIFVRCISLEGWSEWTFENSTYGF